MQSIHRLLFWQGNLEVHREDLSKAKEYFENGRRIIARLSPTYIAAAAFEYKLGCLDLKMMHFDEAMCV